MLALWSVVALGATPLGGVLADRIGRRPVMAAGLAGGAVAAVLFGLASNLWTVAVLIAVWALFTSMFDPAASAYVIDVVAPGLRTEAFGLQRIVANASFALGPPLGAVLIWLVSVRATFVAAGIALLVYLLAVWPRLPETRPARNGDTPPARFRDVLRDRVLVLLALGTWVAAICFSLYEGVLPVFLHDDRGVAVATWGLIFGINPVLITVFQYPVSRWAARWSSRTPLALGALLLGASLALLLPFSGLAAVAAAVVILSFGEMLVVPVALALAGDLAPVHLRGSYQGALNLAWEVAWGPTTIVGLWLVGRGQGEALLGSALAVGAFAALVFLSLPRGRVTPEAPLVRADPAPP